MTINITDTFGTPILAKDVEPSKRTRAHIDTAITMAHHSPTHTTTTHIPMRDGTHTTAIITVD